MTPHFRLIAFLSWTLLLSSGLALLSIGYNEKRAKPLALGIINIICAILAFFAFSIRYS